MALDLIIILILLPNRRYPDVLVHRLLNSYLEDKQNTKQSILEEACKHSSVREQLAKKQKEILSSTCRLSLCKTK